MRSAAATAGGWLGRAVSGTTCSSRYSVPCALLATARVPQQHNSSSSTPSQPHAVNQHQCHQQPEQRIPAGCSSSRGSSSGGSWIVSPWQQHRQQPVISRPHSLPSLSTAAAARAWHSKASFCSATPSNMLPHKQQQRLMSSMPDFHSTTILCVRKGPEVVIMGDGQATQGDFVVKPNVKKVRRIGTSAVGGFAGVAVDGLSLLERLEGKLEEHPGQLQRAAVELAKMWRQDKLLRELDASLIVADASSTFWLMGNGDVLEAEADGVIGIGSGADFAESAARALLQLQRDLQQQQQQQQQQGAEVSAQQGGAAAEPAAAAAGSNGVPPELLPVLEMSLFDVAKAAMTIAANSCIYTNSNFSWQHIKPDGSIETGDASGITNVDAAAVTSAAAGPTSAA